MNDLSTPVRDRLADLSHAGVAVWLDDLSRGLLETGELQRLVQEEHVVGVTTNPTIFAAALSQGDRYDAQLRQLAHDGADVPLAVLSVTTADVRTGCDVLHGVFERTGGLDGRVSIEVEPGLARDPEATAEQAQQLWSAVDRPNLFVKIPATSEGLAAITATIARGTSVNVTLIFSLDRYRAVIDAYTTGLQQAREAGLDLSAIHSVASFFVSRVDVETDARLDAIGTPEATALKGRTAIANARLAYRIHEEALADERWRTLAASGANPQRPLWASTGVKNPDYPDTLYVDELIAPNTVNTMPAATLKAFADHGHSAADTIHGTYAAADAHFDALARAGIDLHDVTETLERQGLEKFEASWTELTAGISAKLEQFSDS